MLNYSLQVTSTSRQLLAASYTLSTGVNTRQVGKDTIYKNNTAEVFISS